MAESLGQLQPIDQTANRSERAAATDRGSAGTSLRKPHWKLQRKPVPPEAVPKRILLQLIGTESEDRLDKKICPWDAIKMYEFEEGQEISEYFYDITKIKEVNGVYVVETEEKERLEEKQAELYE